MYAVPKPSFARFFLPGIIDHYIWVEDPFTICAVPSGEPSSMTNT
jgi:hypothetical protein